MPDGFRLLGVVLCGGRSRRMGQDKAALCTPDGTTFLDVACDRLDALCESVCLSGSSTRETIRCLIADPDESFGPISGILASLQFARHNGFDACVFNPIDTPGLRIDDMSSLIAACETQPRRIVCAQSDDDSNQVQPLIAIYPVHFAAEIQRCITRQQYSLRRFLSDQGVVEIRLPAAACKNINTPDDFHSLMSD